MSIMIPTRYDRDGGLIVDRRELQPVSQKMRWTATDRMTFDEGWFHYVEFRGSRRTLPGKIKEFRRQLSWYGGRVIARKDESAPSMSWDSALQMARIIYVVEPGAFHQAQRHRDAISVW